MQTPYLSVARQSMIPSAIVYATPKGKPDYAGLYRNKETLLLPIPEAKLKWVEAQLDRISTASPTADHTAIQTNLISTLSGVLSDTAKPVRRNACSSQFKQDKQAAVAFVVDSGATAKQAATRYNLNEGSIRVWCQRHRQGVIGGR